MYSGASSVGQYAIQMAKFSGFKVVATASLHRESRLKTLGADAIVDYKVYFTIGRHYIFMNNADLLRQESNLAQKLKDITNDGIAYAIDCFGEGGSTKVCHDAIGPEGGQVVAILPFDEKDITRTNVNASFTLLYTNLTGETVFFGPFACPPAGPHDREDAVKFYQILPQTAVDIGIKYLETHEFQGIDKIPEGLNLLAEGKVQGKKIIVKA